MKRSLVLAAALLVATPARAEERVGVRAFGAWTSEYLYGTPMRFTTLEVAAGMTDTARNDDALVGLSYARGRTAAGLVTHEVVLTPMYRFRLSRLVLGGGARFSYMRIDRATEGAITLGGIGLQGAIGVEAIQWDDHAVFLEARVHLDYPLFGPGGRDAIHFGPGIPGFALGGGFRF